MWKKRKEVRYFTAFLYIAVWKNNIRTLTLKQENGWEQKPSASYLEEKKIKKHFSNSSGCTGKGEGGGGRRGETRTVSISQSQVFTDARWKPWWINPLGQDLLLTVTQTLEQTNLHSHIHKLSVLIHARKHAKPDLPFVSFSRAAGKASPAPSPCHPGRVSARLDSEAQPGKRSWGWTDGGTAGRRRRAAASQSGGGCAGAGRLVRWPQTKARGVGAIVPGTSLRGEAGRRNTSRGETLLTN